MQRPSSHPAHPVIVGGGRYGSEVRWRVGGRTLAISGGDRPDMPLVSVSFVDTEHAEDEEFREVKWGLMQDTPFHWAILLGPETPEDAWVKRCGCLCYNWELFDRGLRSRLPVLAPTTWRNSHPRGVRRSSTSGT